MTDHNLTPEIFGDFGLHLENAKERKMGKPIWTITDGKETLESRDYMDAISQALKLARKPENIQESVTVYDERGAFYDWIKAANELFNTKDGM